MPTAEEFLKSSDTYDEDYPTISLHDAEQRMIEFTRLHVEAALKAASEVYIKVQKKRQYGKYRKWQTVKEGEEVDLFKYEIQYSADKKSILNSYPLTNIK